MRTLILAVLAVALTGALAWADQAPETHWKYMNQQAFSDYVETVRSTMRLPGVSVAVVHREDGVIFAKGFGEHADGAPITPDDPFVLGQLGYGLSAMLALELAQEGKLALDAPVETLVPGLRFEPAPSKPITVQHLLDHTSGLSAQAGEALWTQGTLDLKAPLAMAHPVGQTREVSVLNEALLTKALEAASGQSYPALLKARFQERLEGAAEGSKAVAGHRYLYGLTLEGQEPADAAKVAPSLFVSASARDMGQWLHALLKATATQDKQSDKAKPKGKKARAKKARTNKKKTKDEAPEPPQLQISPGAADALTGKDKQGPVPGWNRHDRKGDLMLTQGGQTLTYSSAMALLPGQDMGVVVLTNTNSYGGMAAEAICEGFVSLLLESTAQVYAFAEYVCRIVLGLFMLLLLLDLMLQAWRWQRLGQPRQLPMTTKRRLRLAFVIGLPVLIPLGVLLFGSMSLPMLLAAQPDLAWALLIGCPLGLLKGILKLFNDAYQQDVVMAG